MEYIEKVSRGIQQCMMSANRDEYDTQCADCPYFDPDSTVAKCMESLKQDILDAVKSKTGVWIKFLPEYKDMFKYSECHVIVRLPFKVIDNCPYDYCPGCGSKMINSGGRWFK